MHNSGLRPKTVLSETGDTTKSMVKWAILTRMNDHSGANLGADFAINMPHTVVLTYLEAYETSILAYTGIGLKRINYGAICPLQPSLTQCTFLAQGTLLSTVK